MVRWKAAAELPPPSSGWLKKACHCVMPWWHERVACHPAFWAPRRSTFTFCYLEAKKVEFVGIPG